MKKNIQQILRVGLLALSFSSFVAAQLPQDCAELMTHRSTKNFLNRLYDLQWLGTTNLCPIITDGIKAYENAGTDEQAQALALATLRAHLNKALAVNTNIPDWVTFKAIERIEMKDVVFGLSVRDLKYIAKIGGATLVAGTLAYLAKKKVDAAVTAVDNRVNAVRVAVNNDVNTALMNFNTALTMQQITLSANVGLHLAPIHTNIQQLVTVIQGTSNAAGKWNARADKMASGIDAACSAIRHPINATQGIRTSAANRVSSVWNRGTDWLAHGAEEVFFFVPNLCEEASKNVADRELYQSSPIKTKQGYYQESGFILVPNAPAGAQGKQATSKPRMRSVLDDSDDEETENI